jgi:hypothetical protein
MLFQHPSSPLIFPRPASLGISFCNFRHFGAL